MNKNKVRDLIKNKQLPDNCENAELKETHISWIILCKNYAFKIKRPVKLSFLNFSTLQKRKEFCSLELELNRRLEPEMYLDVIPITADMFNNHVDNDEIIDYAVKMKRLDNNKEMVEMIKQDKADKKDIDKLAKKIARFHQKTHVVKNAFNTSAFEKDYDKILDEKEFIIENYGNDRFQKIKKNVERSHEYLNSHRNFMNDRIINGFRKDCHGDLNIHNIFLYDEPVIFDCIEFNKELRQIDILNEIAFLTVDLEFYDKQELSDRFFNKYLDYMNIENGQQERQLFYYYKSYRANIRAYVTLIHEKYSNQDNPDQTAMNDIEKYFALMDRYMQEVC